MQRPKGESESRQSKKMYCSIILSEGRSTVTIYTVINNNNGLFETPKIFSCVSKTPYESMGNRTVVEIQQLFLKDCLVIPQYLGRTIRDKDFFFSPFPVICSLVRGAIDSGHIKRMVSKFILRAKWAPLLASETKAPEVDPRRC